MLPKIACLKSGRSGFSRWTLSVCGFAILGLPTWSPQAPSQLGAASTFEDARRTGLATAAPSIEFLPELTSGEKRIQAALEEEIQFDLVDESLEGVAKYLVDRYQLTVVMDIPKLAGQSISPESNDITLKLSGITLRKGLKLILKPKNMTFVIEDEVLKLISLADAQEYKITRFYPARDLAGNSDADDKMLLGIIQSSTYDQSAGIFWLDQDGEGGEISTVPAIGCLMIRATSETHEAVLKVLRTVRQAKSAALGN